MGRCLFICVIKLPSSQKRKEYDKQKQVRNNNLNRERYTTKREGERDRENNSGLIKVQENLF